MTTYHFILHHMRNEQSLPDFCSSFAHFEPHLVDLSPHPAFHCKRTFIRRPVLPFFRHCEANINDMSPHPVWHVKRPFTRISVFRLLLISSCTLPIHRLIQHSIQNEHSLGSFYSRLFIIPRPTLTISHLIQHCT